MADLAAEREAMVEHQLRRRGIADARVLDAFSRVPRELFVDAVHAAKAYGDHPLPIADGQTISQPYIVALMVQEAQIDDRDRVLEVGAGSGYAAAILAEIADQVVAIERSPELASLAQTRLAKLGYSKVAVIEADGSLGWPAAAPYDAILVAASGKNLPPPLIEQLAPGGRLIMPLGDVDGIQRLVKVAKLQDGGIVSADLGQVRFVPLVGEEGWSADRSRR